MRTNNAFSLLEMLLVLVITGIILALAVPNFSKGYSRFELNQTADDLLDAGRWAQAMAIGQQRIYGLSFAVDRRSYGLVRTKPDDPDGQGGFEAVSGPLGRMHDIPRDVSLEVPNDLVEFYPDGTIDAATINLSSPDRKTVLSSAQVRGMMIKVDHE